MLDSQTYTSARCTGNESIAPFVLPDQTPGFPKTVIRCPYFGVSNFSETLDTLVTDITESQKWKPPREDIQQGTWNLA